MDRILISWIATTHDFLKESRQININGIHSELYKYAHDTFDIHYLLVAEHQNKIKTHHERFENRLNIEFNGKTKIIPLDIVDIINVGIIKKKVTSLIVSLGKNPISIFISPGTPAMQVVWYMIAAEFANVKIFQTRPAKYRLENQKDIREFIHVEKTGFANALMVKEHSVKNQSNITNPDVFKTSSQEYVFDQALKVAQCDVATVLYGESGTGKEIIARRIHRNSNRDGKFLALNCASITDTLIESTLFGHEKGSFTSASSKVDGIFLSAKG
ncbi:MAG: sigma 54-interacting transcriptional regulator, partial [Flavobacteriales bacterium]